MSFQNAHRQGVAVPHQYNPRRSYGSYNNNNNTLTQPPIRVVHVEPPQSPPQPPQQISFSVSLELSSHADKNHFFFRSMENRNNDNEDSSSSPLLQSQLQTQLHSKLYSPAQQQQQQQQQPPEQEEEQEPFTQQEPAPAAALQPPQPSTPCHEGTNKNQQQPTPGSDSSMLPETQPPPPVPAAATTPTVRLFVEDVEEISPRSIQRAQTRPSPSTQPTLRSHSQTTTSSSTSDALYSQREAPLTQSHSSSQQTQFSSSTTSGTRTSGGTKTSVNLLADDGDEGDTENKQQAADSNEDKTDDEGRNSSVSGRHAVSITLQRMEREDQQEAAKKMSNNAASLMDDDDDALSTTATDTPRAQPSSTSNRPPNIPPPRPYGAENYINSNSDNKRTRFSNVPPNRQQSREETMIREETVGTFATDGRSISPINFDSNDDNGDSNDVTNSNNTNTAVAATGSSTDSTVLLTGVQRGVTIPSDRPDFLQCQMDVLEYFCHLATLEASSKVDRLAEEQRHIMDALQSSRPRRYGRLWSRLIIATLSLSVGCITRLRTRKARSHAEAEDDYEDYFCAEVPSDEKRNSGASDTTGTFVLDVTENDWTRLRQEFHQAKNWLLRHDSNLWVPMVRTGYPEYGSGTAPHNSTEKVNVSPITIAPPDSRLDTGLKKHSMFQQDTEEVDRLLHLQQTLAVFRTKLRKLASQQNKQAGRNLQEVVDEYEQNLVRVFGGTDQAKPSEVVPRELLNCIMSDIYQPNVVSRADPSGAAVTLRRLIQHTVEIVVKPNSAYGILVLQRKLRGLLVKWSESILALPTLVSMGYGGVITPTIASAVNNEDDDDVSSYGMEVPPDIDENTVSAGVATASTATQMQIQTLTRRRREQKKSASVTQILAQRCEADKRDEDEVDKRDEEITAPARRAMGHMPNREERLQELRAARQAMKENLITASAEKSAPSKQLGDDGSSRPQGSENHLQEGSDVTPGNAPKPRREVPDSEATTDQPDASIVRHAREYAVAAASRRLATPSRERRADAAAAAAAAAAVAVAGEKDEPSTPAKAQATSVTSPLRERSKNRCPTETIEYQPSPQTYVEGERMNSKRSLDYDIIEVTEVIRCQNSSQSYGDGPTPERKRQRLSTMAVRGTPGSRSSTGTYRGRRIGTPGGKPGSRTRGREASPRSSSFSPPIGKDIIVLDDNSEGDSPNGKPQERSTSSSRVVQQRREGGWRQEAATESELWADRESADGGSNANNSRKRQRTLWSADETSAVLEGYKKYGQRWRLIKDNCNGRLCRRTNVQIKDKFRTLVNQGLMDGVE